MTPTGILPRYSVASSPTTYQVQSNPGTFVTPQYIMQPPLAHVSEFLLYLQIYYFYRQLTRNASIKNLKLFYRFDICLCSMHQRHMYKTYHFKSFYFQ